MQLEKFTDIISSLEIIFLYVLEGGERSFTFALSIPVARDSCWPEANALKIDVVAVGHVIMMALAI